MSDLDQQRSESNFLLTKADRQAVCIASIV